MTPYEENGNTRVGGAIFAAIRYPNARFTIEIEKFTLFIKARKPLLPHPLTLSFNRDVINGFRIYSGPFFSIVQIQHQHPKSRPYVAFETMNLKKLLQTLHDFGYPEVEFAY